MEFNQEKVKELVKSYWNQNWRSLTFKRNGNEVKPDSVSSIDVKLTPGDFIDGYNFQCNGYNLLISINNVESHYSADFTIKVVPVIEDGNSMPNEVIVGVLHNLVILTKK